MTASRSVGRVPEAVGEGFELPKEVEKGGWFGQIRYFFAGSPAVNFLMILAIVIGFFQGWLKIRFRYSWVTFAFDIPLVLAFIITVFSVGRGRRLFPDCNMSKVLIALTSLGFIYTVLPFGIPWLISIAGFRGWCFIPLMFLVGYHSTRSVRQVEVYLWLLVVLGIIVAFYGIFMQNEAEIRLLMEQDPELQFRLQNQWYSDSAGRGVFRRFSTFVSSAAFGGMMAYCSTFAISRLAHPGCSWPERIFLIAASLLMSYGVVLSGSRSTLVGLLVGVSAAIWYRRNATVILVIPVAVVLGLAVGLIYGGAAGIERYASLLDISILWKRVDIVIGPALESLMEKPLGRGMGASGHGIPVIFIQQLMGIKPVLIDGDMGQLAVDMGVFGLIVFVALLVVGVTDAFHWMSSLRGSPMGVIGLPAGSMFVLASLQLIYGSPFLAIPGGVLLWFFLGAMRRLYEDYQKLAAVVGEEVADVSAQFVSFITKNRLIPLYKQAARGTQEPGRVQRLHRSESKAPLALPRTDLKKREGASIGSVTAGPAPSATKLPATSPIVAGARPAKRFLFRRPTDAPDRRPPRRQP